MVAKGRTAEHLTVGRGARSVDGLDVVRLAEHPVLRDAELLARRQLPLAGVAGEAGEVVDLLLGLAHPVRGRDHAAALEALGAEHLGVVDLAVEPVLAQEAARVRVHDGVADAAAQALRVPRPVRHLEDVAVGDDVAAERALVALGLQRQRGGARLIAATTNAQCRRERDYGNRQERAEKFVRETDKGIRRK